MSGNRLQFNLKINKRPGNRLLFNLGQGSVVQQTLIRVNFVNIHENLTDKQTFILTALNWQDSDIASTANIVPWEKTDILTNTDLIAWKDSFILSSTKQLQFGASKTQANSYLSIWKQLGLVLQNTSLPIGVFKTERNRNLLLWYIPEIKTKIQGFAYAAPGLLQKTFVLSWIASKLVRGEQTYPWYGLGQRLPWYVVTPPLPVPVIPKNKSIGNRLLLNLRCKNKYPGNRVPLNLGGLSCSTVQTTKGVIVVKNEAYMKRIPDNKPVPVFSATISANVDDYCWTLQADIDYASIVDLEPNVNGPIEVEFGVNGNVWRFLIENIDRSETRTNKTLDRTAGVFGRSKTVLLDAPYAPKRSKTNTAVRTSQQLINDELTYLANYSTDYDIVLWTVPAGAFTYEASTPIDVARTVANAAGACLLSHKTDPTILVRKRYPVSPWDWTNAAIDRYIPSSIVVNLNCQVENKPLYNAVVVQGQQQGVIANVKRSGSAGDNYQTQVIDQLILQNNVAVERGREILCDRGNQSRYTLKMPLFPLPLLVGQPGLIEPLHLCSYSEGVPWIGLAISVVVTVDMEGKSLIVWQTVQLERHLSDAN
jgi:hypothetical protein